MNHRPHSHCSVFVMILFRCMEAILIHITPFLHKNGGKYIHFCPFTLSRIISNTQPKISIFVRSHFSGLVKLTVEYWSVYKNFCTFTLTRSVSKISRFCGYLFLIAFLRNRVFVAFLRGSVRRFSQKWSFLFPFFYQNGVV